MWCHCALPFHTTVFAGAMFLSIIMTLIVVVAMDGILQWMLALFFGAIQYARTHAPVKCLPPPPPPRQLGWPCSVNPAVPACMRDHLAAAATTRDHSPAQPSPAQPGRAGRQAGRQLALHLRVDCAALPDGHLPACLPACPGSALSGITCCHISPSARRGPKRCAM
jgi:hypothetical protein